MAPTPAAIPVASSGCFVITEPISDARTVNADPSADSAPPIPVNAMSLARLGVAGLLSLLSIDLRVHYECWAERLGSDTANRRRGKYDRQPRAVVCIRFVRPWLFVVHLLTFTGVPGP